MRLVIICIAALLLTACAGSGRPAAPPAVMVDGWPRVAAAAAGFDAARLRQLTRRLEAGDFPNTHMVLIEHDGRLVYEKYLSGRDQNWGTAVGVRDFDADSLHDLRSISKSVTALLLGIALGAEFEAALSRPVLDYLPGLAAKASPGFENITLHHVLTMTAGFDWNEMDVPYTSPSNDELRMYYSVDPIEYLLAKNIVNAPGEYWYYNGGGTMLLAALVVEISGMPFLEFAQQALFEPLGIERSRVEWRGLGTWPRRPRLPSAASGLRLRGRDLARIGALMQSQGRWQGRQIVPARWIEISSRRHTEQGYDIWSNNGFYGYAYHWWHGRFETAGKTFETVAGVGYGGQRLFVVPREKLSVTVFAGNYGTGEHGVSERILLEILAALR